MKNKFPKFKIKFLLFFLFLSITGFSQTTIYSEDFNSNLGNWVLPNSTTKGTKSWVYGSNSLHSSGASGNYIYSDSPGKSNKYKSNSYILAISPEISTVGHANLTFQFDVWFNTGNQAEDGIQVQYSFNGTSWNVLGDPNDANWYNDWSITIGSGGWSGASGGWVTKSINLSTENSSFNNNSKVQFRVVFASTNYSSPPSNSGVAFDNILITKPAPEYCTPININNYNINFISNVSLGAINNTTNGNTGAYNNYTSLATIDANAGINLNGNISINLNGWNQVTSNKINIWIDFNQDLDFEDAGENFIINVNSGASVSGTKTIVVPISILIPATAALGNTRIRIGFIDDIQTASYSACNFAYNTGEIEDYTINIAGCSTNVWTGATDKDWNKNSNWSCGTVPTMSTHVTIPSSLASGNYPIIYSGDPYGKANNIEIQNNSATTLEIRDNYIQISGTLLLNGVMDLVGEGQLLQTATSTVDNASTGYIERDQQGQGNKYRYNDWSSPVIKTGTANGTAFTVPDVLRDGTDANNPKAINFVGGYDGATGTPISIAHYWMYKYANSPSGDYNAWQQIRNTGTLKPGEGFLMKGTGVPGSPDQNYVFVGKPNNGTIGLTVAGNYDYLVGNPYPSAIDAKQFLLDNSPSGTGAIGGSGAIYFWEHYGGNSHNLRDYQAGYATLTISGGVPATAGALAGVSSSGTPVKTPGMFIPIGQGFFVVGDADGGTIEFNNGQRVFVTEANATNSIFMKGVAQKTTKESNILVSDTRPKFRVGFSGAKIDHRQILFTVDEHTTDGVDWGYEAEIYELFEDDMFWTIDDKKYVIQASNSVDINKEIPLGITSSGGSIAINMDALENVDDSTDLFIKDSLTGLLHPIKNQSFEIDLPKGEYLNRFSFVFKTPIVLEPEEPIEEIISDGILVFMDNSIKELQIRKVSTEEIETVVLYNSLGQMSGYWKKDFSADSFSLPVKAASGIYFVQIHTKNGRISKKVLVE